MKETSVLIVGASVSGLACAACLQNAGIDYIIIEKQDEVVKPWRRHYERLHLHTSKKLSGLPFKKFGKTIPKYPSRQQVVDYLESYKNEFAINVGLNTEAIAIKKVGEHWIIETTNGIFRSKFLIVCTGAYSKPRLIQFTGMETFKGEIFHSSAYKTGAAFKGQKILVIGFGNSACEIAIDLFEQGAFPSMSVRSAVNVVPRDVFGISILKLSLLLKRLTPRIADAVSAPLVKSLIGDISRLGLKKLSYGPLQQIQKDGSVPLLDIGTIKHIRKGDIKIYDEIDHANGNSIIFKSGRKENFDAIVAAIGYDKNHSDIVAVDKVRFEDLKFPTDHQRYFGKDGLYFCGYWISPTGQFREIGLDAIKIAKDISKVINNA